MREEVSSVRIEDGWRFYSADFSIQAGEKSMAGIEGQVVLVRDPESRALWHKMTQEEKNNDDGPPLYIHAYGMTLEKALAEANSRAANAKPVTDK